MSISLRQIVLTVVTAFACVSADAQIYKTSLDIRLDNELVGIGMTQKLLPQITAFAAFDFKRDELKATGMLRYHIKWAGRRINFYPSVGIHAGEKKNYGSFRGIDLALGAEYKSILLPIVVSYEFQPSIHLSGAHPDFYNLQSVLTLRYVIIKDKKKLFDGKGKRKK